VSQDPLLLSNETLRFNLDPGISVHDNVLTTALTTAGPWSHFCDGTATHVSGATFSRFGEHPVLDRKPSLLRGLVGGAMPAVQGVCRALVKASSLPRDSGAKAVVLLDEVALSLDVAHRVRIHHIIDVEFTEKGLTVVVVAHRLVSPDPR